MLTEWAVVMALLLGVNAATVEEGEGVNPRTMFPLPGTGKEEHRERRRNGKGQVDYPSRSSRDHFGCARNA